MPRETWERQYCYCLPPRHLVRLRPAQPTWAERQRRFWREVGAVAGDVAAFSTTPVVGFFTWLRQPAAAIQMVERKDTEPMCGRSFVAEKRDMDDQASGSLSQAETQRRVHRELFDAVKNADTWNATQEAVKAWDDHMAEHREQAAAIRAGRIK